MNRSIFNSWGYPLLAWIGLCLASCESDPPVPVHNFDLPSQVLSVVSQKQLNDFKNAGMTIHEGSSPFPIFNSRSFTKTRMLRFAVDHICIFDSRNEANIGQKYDQFNDSLSILVNANKEFEAHLGYNSGTDSGSGSGFASGEGEKFSIFIEVKNGIVNRVPYRALWIVSGTQIRNTDGVLGIQNLQDGFMMLEKGNDPEDLVANPGTIRIFEDSFAERIR